MRQPALLPHRVLGAMRQHLDASFRIAPRSNRTTVNAATSGPATVSTGRWNCTSGRMAKPASVRPPVLALGVGNRERGEMHPGMTRQRQIELAAERRIGGLEQHLDIAAAEHRGDVAGSGRRAVGIVCTDCGVGAKPARASARLAASASRTKWPT